MVEVLWRTDAVLTLVLLFSLGRTGRLRETHHGYFGIAAVVVGLALGWTWLVWAGSVALVDDTFQHFVQLLDKLRGSRVRPDFTPLHWLGVWLIIHLEILRAWR